MIKIWTIAWLIGATTTSAEIAAPASGDPVMGTWSGLFHADSGDTGPFQMQVVPQGAGAYSLWVRMGDQGSRYEIKGASESGRLRFSGRYQMASGTDEAAYELIGEIAADRATGSFASSELNGTIELHKQRNVIPNSAPPPADVIVLYDRSATEHWQRADGRAPDWPVRADGSLEAGGADLVTRKSFSGFKLHLEFLLPLQPEARGQQRGNSGIVVGGSCEIHILDSFAQEPTKGSCGAIFGVAAPRADACFPPLEWQAFDITLRAPASDASGKQIQNADITVVLNGVVLHERRKLDEFHAAPLRLRAGGSTVRFRNIWLQPIVD